jgi:hypothetical protein
VTSCTDCPLLYRTKQTVPTLTLHPSPSPISFSSLLSSLRWEKSDSSPAWLINGSKVFRYSPIRSSVLSVPAIHHFLYLVSTNSSSPLSTFHCYLIVNLPVLQERRRGLPAGPRLCGPAGIPCESQVLHGRTCARLRHERVCFPRR